MSPPVHLLHICLCVFKVLLVVRAHQFYVALVTTAPVTEGVSVTRIVRNRMTAVLTIVQPVNNVSEDKHRLEIHTFTFDYKCSRCKQRLLKKLQHYICNKYHNGFFVSASTVSPTLSSVSTKPTTGLSPFKSYFKNSHLHIHIVCVTPEKSV